MKAFSLATTVLSSAFCLLTISVLPAPALPPGDMRKIEIKGLGLAKPIEITAEIGKFYVWAGPGVRVNGVEQTEGFVIDWSKGIAKEVPVGLQHYEAFFYSNFRRKSGSIVYVVSYDYDPASQQGYIYLPGKVEDYVYLPGKPDEWYHVNTSTIARGRDLEGNWFYATSDWENFVRPLIAKARATCQCD